MKRIGIFLGGIIFLYIFCVILINVTTKKEITTTTENTQTTTSTVKKEDLIVGTGAQANTGDTVSVN